MPDNIFSSNDDDIFEEYVENTSFDENVDLPPDTNQTIDKLFTDLDSPFKKLLQNSSLKVNLSEAFYSAADQWVTLGYKEAHTAAVVKQLAELTEGKFLYHHRLECSKEVIARKKTVIRFLTLMLDSDSESSIINAANDFKLNLSRSYFDIFFRSYYNIQVFMFQHEVALYKSLCDIMGIEQDSNLCDLNQESEIIQNTADVINDLYIQYFDKDALEERLKEYVKEFRNKEA